MKRLTKTTATLVAAVMMLLTFAPEANAAGPVRFGLRAGATISSMKFNESAFSSSNRMGYSFGPTVMFNLPIVGIGLDASLLFTRRTASVTYTDPEDPTDYSKENIGRSYIEIPVNMRWNIGLPLVGKFITPFLLTGPDFSFLVSQKNVKNAWNNRKFDFAWNFGFGVRLINRLDLQAAYALGINNSASGDASLYGPVSVSSKNRGWNVGLTWLF